MKKYIKPAAFLLMMAVLLSETKAQKTANDSTGLPGDNFSLQGALEMFQKASSPEEFEKLLNTKDNNVNNLDLNKDGKTDYVKVIDKSEKNSHAFILQVPVSQTEKQDIAVIELEKTGDTTAIIQIVGDKDIYGKEVIIEPESSNVNASVSERSRDGRGPSNVFYDEDITTIIVNVWYWPSVSFIYSPVYTPWISPWAWGYYPGWWVTWRPLAWSAWHPYCVVYNSGYVAVNTYRVTNAHYLYTPYRSSSISVSRQAAVVAGPNRVAAGTKTTVTGPAGRSATKVTGTIGGPNGATRVTTVRRGRF